MTLDPAPPQLPLLRLDDFLPYRLSFTSNALSERIAAAYADRFDLSIPQWRLIAVAAEAGRVSQQTIVSRTGMDKVTVSRAAIALEERGLIARHADPDDRRSRPMALTDAGRALYAEVAPRALELEQNLLACLSATEKKTLAALLRRIDTALSD